MSNLLDTGNTLLAEGRLTDAIGCYQHNLEKIPGHVGTLNNLASALQAAGRFGEANAIYHTLLQYAKKPLAWRIASNYLVGLQYQFEITPETLQASASELGRQYGEPDISFLAPSGLSSRPLRIGFVSADLCDHPVGFYLLPFLQHLDRNSFMPFLYVVGGRDDETARALKTFAEWHDVTSLDHNALLMRLRADQLDILVDLSGHTSGNRLPVFARRTAPLQVSWLGYFATTGIPAMDYVLMDPWHVAEGAENQFTEKVLRLPHSRFCYQPVSFAPEVSPPPCLANDFITFGSFNNTSKYNPVVFSCWARLLLEVPSSRLILKWRTFIDPAYCEQVWSIFEVSGVVRERIELRKASFHRPLLEQYADVDIALDPFPFSGGHTSCEALWMGLPVVTLPGERPVSRQTFCFIGNLGQKQWLEDWVAGDVEEYVAKAAVLAQNKKQLTEIRSSLRVIMLRSPLMDAYGFTRNVEDAFRQMLPLSREYWVEIE